jgi:hypothetical protein
VASARADPAHSTLRFYRIDVHVREPRARSSGGSSDPRGGSFARWAKVCVLDGGMSQSREHLLKRQCCGAKSTEDERNSQKVIRPKFDDDSDGRRPAGANRLETNGWSRNGAIWPINTESLRPDPRRRRGWVDPPPLK